MCLKNQSINMVFDAYCNQNDFSSCQDQFDNRTSWITMSAPGGFMVTFLQDVTVISKKLATSCCMQRGQKFHVDKLMLLSAIVDKKL